MAVKIKLKRMGKTRNPQYRIVIADSRTARSGRAIEEIGVYQPRQEPSLISVNSERVQYWLGVGAQPTEPVLAILKVTGDWQRFKGLEGAEGTLRVAEPKPSKQSVFEAAVRSAEEVGKTPRPKAPKAQPVAEPVEEVAAVETAASGAGEAAAEPAADAAVAAAEAPAGEAVEAAQDAAEAPATVQDAPDAAASGGA